MVNDIDISLFSELVNNKLSKYIKFHPESPKTYAPYKKYSRIISFHSQ